MDLLFRSLALWGIADSLWMALAPASWARFWGGWIGRIGRGGLLARAAAAFQFALSAYMLLRNGRR